MKKILSLFVVLAGFAVFAVFAEVAFAASLTAVDYYDARGVPVYGDDLYQTVAGWLYFGRDCYYFDRYGNKVSANGRRVFYYDIHGNFLAGKQVSQPQQVYYDTYGNLIVANSSDYRSGGYSNYRYESDNGK